jgi:hypothetical protein
MILPLPPRFLGREDKALQCLSGIFQSLGGAFFLVGGFAAASLSVHSNALCESNANTLHTEATGASRASADHTPAQYCMSHRMQASVHEFSTCTSALHIEFDRGQTCQREVTPLPENTW